MVVSTLTAGNHSLTAVYGGSLDFLASTSTAVTQVVNAAGPPPPPPGATDTVTITLAQQVLRNGQLRVEGINTPITGGGFAASVEIHSGMASGTTCPGALIGTKTVNANGVWKFRSNTDLTANVCVKSAGGGMAASAVTPN